ncbi:MAG: hypothetical protein R3C29_03055 [Dehalococcoidia bacterium]
MQQVATATLNPAAHDARHSLSLSLATGLLFGLLLGGAIVVLLATRLFGFAVVTITSGQHVAPSAPVTSWW